MWCEGSAPTVLSLSTDGAEC